MKNLNLKDCGLVELNQKELQMFDGGLPWDKAWKMVVKVYNAIGAADAVNEFCEGFKEGYNSK